MEARKRGMRRGGRAARQAERAAPLQEELRPVRPGMPGGWFVPLSDGDVGRIHQAVLELLETVGVADPIPSCVEAITAAGGELNADGRLLFPRALVEDMVARAARNITLHAQDPAHDMALSGKNVHFGTAGAAVHMVDAETGEYRDSTLADLYDIARLVDRLDNIHFFQRPVTARDMTGGRALDINTLYACISGTTKHVGTSFVSPMNVEEGLRLLHIVCGGEAAWRARPFVSMSNCFIVPPLRFAEDACATLEAGVRGGMPVLLLSAGQAGATSPAALAGAVVQQMAEVLAGIVYVNAIIPGHPTIIGPWPFVSDLRSGAMSGGSGEQALLSAACAQMAHFYDLPVGVPAGMTDSKVPDAQAGYEKGYTNAIVGLAGANMVYESAGEPARLLHGELRHRQRHPGRVDAHRARHRGVGQEPFGPCDTAGLHRGARPFPGPRPDPEADAAGIFLSDGRRPHEPQGMEGDRRHQRGAEGVRQGRRDPVRPLS